MDPSNPLVQQRATLNPYATAANLIKERLLWDIKPESWRSRAQMKRVHDAHAGKKAVILCNGPSLLKVDLKRLKAAGVYTFGLNKVNLLFENTDFRPSSVVCVNSLVLEQNADFYNQTEIPLYLESFGLNFVRPRGNVTFFREAKFPKFSRDCSMGLYSGATVTFVALQLAFHMGFSKVALVGADHNFAVKGAANKTVEGKGEDLSHFHPQYFAHGVKWQLPDLVQSEYSYAMARDMYEAFGRKVYNATEGGLLEIFERASLDQFLDTL